MIEMSILENAIERGDIEASRMIVEHVAAIEASTGKPGFDAYNLAVINTNSEIKSHYGKYQIDLAAAMRNCKIKHSSVYEK